MKTKYFLYPNYNVGRQYRSLPLSYYMDIGPNVSHHKKGNYLKTIFHIPLLLLN
jgi:hypothetical protein